MKIEDLAHINEESAKKIIVDLYNSFESDADYYADKVKKEPNDLLLYNIFKTRTERVQKYLKRYEKNS